jgi:hypothetical protein
MVVEKDAGGAPCTLGAAPARALEAWQLVEVRKRRGAARLHQRRGGRETPVSKQLQAPQLLAEWRVGQARQTREPEV